MDLQLSVDLKEKVLQKELSFLSLVDSFSFSAFCCLSSFQPIYLTYKNA